MGLRQTFKDNIPDSIWQRLRSLKAVVVPKHKIGQFAIERHVRAILKNRRIDLVIDVGANAGQFGKFIRDDVGFDGPLISFEPVPTTFSILQKTAQGDANWSVFNLALGQQKGVLPINVMELSLFNSFRTPASENLFPSMNKIVSTVDVQIERLDDFLNSKNIKFERAFLKMDTQGYDLEVFSGADGILDRVEAVESEMSFLPIYDSMPDFQSVLNVMRDKGFAISGIYPVTLTNLQAIECDCLMVKERERVSGDHIPYQVLLNPQVQEHRG